MSATSFFSGLMAMFPLFYMLSFFVSIGFYVLSSLGLYSMASNTGVSNPWLAWIPFANLFLLGSMADRCNLNTAGKNTKYKIILPVLNLAIIPVSYFMVFMAIMQSAFTEEYYGYGGDPLAGIGSLLAMVFIILIFACANFVFYLICYNKLFQDFEPSRAAIFTVVAFFNFACIPLFMCRNNVPVGIAGVCEPLQPKYNVNPTNNSPGGYSQPRQAGRPQPPNPGAYNQAPWPPQQPPQPAQQMPQQPGFGTYYNQAQAQPPQQQPPQPQPPQQPQPPINQEASSQGGSYTEPQADNINREDNEHE